jgi:hypothetical protein
MREMIPFYPVCVLIIANALDYTPDFKIIRPVLVLCTGILFYQFAVKINTKSGADLRDEIFSYAASHDITGEREAYLRFLDDCRTKFKGNPAVDFYAQKLEFFWANGQGE